MSGDLFDKITFNAPRLKEICPSIFTTGTVYNDNDVSIDLIKDDELLLLSKDYYDKVEEGNRYFRELKEIEEDYLKKKYGDTLYEYLEKKRKDYIDKRDNADGCDISFEEIYNDISNIDLTQVRDLKKSINSIENDVISMVNESETNKRKVEYRHDVTLHVMNQSKKANYIYYFIVICILIFLYSRNALNVQKNIFLYALVLVFPLLYHYIFIALVYVYNLIQHHFNQRGPKNAFLDNAIDIDFLDDYDI